MSPPEPPGTCRALHLRRPARILVRSLRAKPLKDNKPSCGFNALISKQARTRDSKADA